MKDDAVETRRAAGGRLGNLHQARVRFPVDWAGALLLLILLGALLARLAAVRFGLPAMLDPDELMFEIGAYKMLSGGHLDPGWFGHPATTTMYLLAVIDIAVFAIGHSFGIFAGPHQFANAIFFDPSLIVLPGRIAMCLFGAGTVFLTYRLATRIFDRATGLVAAALTAASPVDVAWSQVVRSDMMATFFLLATMLVALSFARSGSRRHLLLACLLAALAITSKWPFGIAALTIPGALWIRLRDDRIDRRAALRQLLAAAALTAVLVLCISPYLLLDFQTVWADLHGEAQQHHIGATGGGFLWNSWYYVSGPLLDGLGLVVLCLAVGGLSLRRGRAVFWPIVIFPAAVMFVVIVAQHIVWERWMIPMVPVLAIAAASGARTLWRWGASRVPVRLCAAVAAGVALAVFIPLLRRDQTNAVERLHDDRRIATDWARDHLPPGSTVLVEHFAFDLIDAPFELKFPVGTGGCFNARRLLENRIDYAEIDALRGGNANLDYGAVSDTKQESCRADYAILTEYSRYASERGAFPEQYSRYRALLERSRIIARFDAVPGRIGGRPEVLVVKIAKPKDVPGG